MVEPITPDEVVAAKAKILPDEVIEVFNELIAKHWAGHSSKFKQSEAEEIIAARLAVHPKFLYQNNYMDVEDIYREQGWSVTYDKPGYNEMYEATYEFEAPPRLQPLRR